MILTLVVFSVFSFGIFLNFKNANTPKLNRDDPLIITDYLNNGNAELARELSRVEPLVNNIESYSGYFRVSDDCVRNMFFWFFPAQNQNMSAPVLVWLQGGPGASSLYGLFEENGPFTIDADLNVILRNVTWTNKYSVIYIDNPVGTGFSFCDAECLLTNEEQVGRYLSIFAQQFFQLFPKLRSNPFYVTGESYAGKYIPAMVNAIHEMNQKSSTPINLKGMLIGDGLCDPYNMMDYGTYLYSIGLIFDNQIVHFNNYRDQIRQSIEKEDFMSAFTYFDEMLNGDITPYPSLFYNLTGLTNYFNYYQDNIAPYYYEKWISQNSKRLNVGNRDFYIGNRVEVALLDDMMRSVAPYVKAIINNGYKVMFFSGQLDVIVPYPMTSEFLSQLEWEGKDAFTNAHQQVWYSKGEPRRVNGYVRSANNVQQVIVRDSGHMVPTDQPQAAMDMLDNFIYGRHF